MKILTLGQNTSIVAEPKVLFYYSTCQLYICGLILIRESHEPVASHLKKLPQPDRH